MPQLDVTCVRCGKGAQVRLPDQRGPLAIIWECVALDQTARPCGARNLVEGDAPIIHEQLASMTGAVMVTDGDTGYGSQGHV